MTRHTAAGAAATTTNAYLCETVWKPEAPTEGQQQGHICLRRIAASGKKGHHTPDETASAAGLARSCLCLLQGALIQHTSRAGRATARGGRGTPRRLRLVVLLRVLVVLLVPVLVPVLVLVAVAVPARVRVRVRAAAAVVRLPGVVALVHRGAGVGVAVVGERLLVVPLPLHQQAVHRRLHLGLVPRLGDQLHRAPALVHQDLGAG